MCVFQDGLKEGVVEKSVERLKRCRDGLMLFLRLSCGGKVCCSCNVPINSFHYLLGDLPAVGGKCQILQTSLEIMLFLVGLWPKPSTQLLLQPLTECSGAGKSCRSLCGAERCSTVWLVLRSKQRL